MVLTRAGLYDPDVKSSLEGIYKRFTVVTTDKTAKKFTFISKEYLEVLSRHWSFQLKI